ncbi:MAG TPA: hypothetical protein H9861_00345 [Candidatus Ligilactobacillus excrementigallinarum]|uniref:Lipoprotein n=1 Tax=Candidatus Ligilactobacillus excrementigallinarum TaxID=2838641 RepID=A0A9D2A8X1_9LACO|nr:hypothetical protein [Candidatus Ligilactobacillus excrementigallinarum]
MKYLITLLSVVLLLGGCSNSNSESKKTSSSSQTETSSAIESSVKKEDSKVESSSQMNAESSPQMSTASITSSQVEKSSKTDLKNLTATQVNQWVYNAMTTQAPMNAFIFTQSKDESGCIVIQVKENHQSDWMKQHSAVEEVNPTVAYYRIDAAGNLQKGMPGSNWDNTNVPYPGN